MHYFLPNEWEMANFYSLIKKAKRHRDRCLKRYKQRIRDATGKGYTKKYMPLYDNMFHLQEQLDFLDRYILELKVRKSLLN